MFQNYVIYDEIILYPFLTFVHSTCNFDSKTKQSSLRSSKSAKPEIWFKTYLGLFMIIETSYSEFGTVTQ